MDYIYTEQHFPRRKTSINKMTYNITSNNNPITINNIGNNLNFTERVVDDLNHCDISSIDFNNPEFAKLLLSASFRFPTRITEAIAFEKWDYYDVYYVCPRCKITLERDYQYCCDRCGQRSLWNCNKVKYIYK